jgi:hypothetical protein
MKHLCPSLLFGLLVVLILLVPVASAQGTYIQIDYPGTTETYVFGIDTAGDVTGTYVGADGIYGGFVLINGASTLHLTIPESCRRPAPVPRA